MSQSVKVLEGAEDLFMRYGLKSVTMDDISKHLGISKKTLYQYVTNKADLISQIIQDKLEFERNMMASIRENAQDAIEEIFVIAQYVVEMLRKMSPSVMFDLQKYYKTTWEKFDQIHQKDVYNIIKSNIEVGIQQGVYRKDLNSDIIAKLYVGKTTLVSDEFYFPSKDYNKEVLFKAFIEYHVRGIASSKGLKLLEKHFANF